MSSNYAIIGGDLRIVKLAKMMADEGNVINTFGLEQAEELSGCKNIVFHNSLGGAAESADIVIAPIPFSKNGVEINATFSNKKISVQELLENIKHKKLIAGSIKQEIYDIAKEKDIEVIDIMKNEDVAILNAISTAEGAIEDAFANTEKTLHGSNVLILGFGRLGKVLAKKLEGLSAKVTCAARKNEDFAWIKAYGYESTNINSLSENLHNYDIIINTVPILILNKMRLQKLKKDCLLIDLASNPGGIDFEEAQKLGIKCIWALALPGKVAPVTTAEIIKNSIYNMLNNC